MLEPFALTRVSRFEDLGIHTSDRWRGRFLHEFFMWVETPTHMHVPTHPWANFPAPDPLMDRPDGGKEVVVVAGYRTV